MANCPPISLPTGLLSSKCGVTRRVCAKSWTRADNVSELLLNTAIEHRLMHAETLAYMLHQLPLEKKIRQPQADVPDRDQPRPETIHIPAGRTTLGLSRSECRIRLG